VFLFTSTAEVYGASFLSGTAREDTPTAPTNAYAVSKLAAEYILQNILPPATRLIIARAFNHSGPGQDGRFVLPSFAAQIARAEAGSGPAVIRVGNLDAERDFLHVADVVEAYIALLAATGEQPRLTQVNVASGEAWRLRGLLEGLLARARRSITVEVDPARMRPADIPRVVGDASRLRDLTGWRPRLGVDAILDDLLAYFRAREAEP
jgi:GDP-4-dehydro-6-deoxy-D-mannose reductase